MPDVVLRALKNPSLETFSETFSGPAGSTWMNCPRLASYQIAQIRPLKMGTANTPSHDDFSISLFPEILYIDSYFLSISYTAIAQLGDDAAYTAQYCV